MWKTIRNNGKWGKGGTKVWTVWTGLNRRIDMEIRISLSGFVVQESSCEVAIVFASSISTILQQESWLEKRLIGPQRHEEFFMCTERLNSFIEFAVAFVLLLEDILQTLLPTIWIHSFLQEVPCSCPYSLGENLCWKHNWNSGWSTKKRWGAQNGRHHLWTLQ